MADLGYCGQETPHIPDSQLATGVHISDFPHEVRGASADWTRAGESFGGRSSA
jgi:hypothetical protein